MIWDAYNRKTLFITGSTGFLASGLLLRLLSRSSPARVFVLIRGGKAGAQTKWTKLLGAAHASLLIKDPRIVILDGDMQAIDLGLSKSDLDDIRQSVHFLIHAASSISLRMKLRDLSYSVVAPSVFLARLAFSSPSLERFVFISTAYSNSHLWALPGAKDDVDVEETIYPLKQGEDPLLSATTAWRDIQQTGATAEYGNGIFPWGYGYAKHLTERLLHFYAAKAGVSDKLLVVRPSVIGPAERFPYPGFSTASSTPTTSCATAFILHPSKNMLFASRLADPSRQSTIDEVPVDVVVDRILAHTAAGTSGIVHAVAGAKSRITIAEWAQANNRERRLPWKVNVRWVSDDWNSRKVSQLARIFKIIGASYNFAEEKTVQLAQTLTADELVDLSLFMDKPTQYSLANRRDQIREIGAEFAKRKGWPSGLVNVLLRSQKVSQAQLAATLGVEQLTAVLVDADDGRRGSAVDSVTPVGSSIHHDSSEAATPVESEGMSPVLEKRGYFLSTTPADLVTALPKLAHSQAPPTAIISV
ncbi:hypothetical protein OC845_006415 [Tilletia horrida]|nr:hypothetical protein OC845_006415 [Tilletia horrida]